MRSSGYGSTGAGRALGDWRYQRLGGDGQGNRGSVTQGLWINVARLRVDCNITSFFVRCNTPRYREAVYKCLSGPNPYLRQEAIRAVPSLHMEKGVHALPELLDDAFILGGSYTEYSGDVARTGPATAGLRRGSGDVHEGRSRRSAIRRHHG